MSKARNRRKAPRRAETSGIAICTRVMPTLCGLVSQPILAAQGYVEISLPRVRFLDQNPRYQSHDAGTAQQA